MSRSRSSMTNRARWRLKRDCGLELGKAANAPRRDDASTENNENPIAFDEESAVWLLPTSLT